MAAPRAGSISRAALTGVLVTCLVVMSAWECGSLLLAWSARRDAVVAAGNLVARRLANTLVNPLWNYDHEDVVRATEFELRAPEILAVIVENDRGAVETALAARVDGAVAPFDPARDGAGLLRNSLAAASQPVLRNGKQLGRVTVHASRASLRSALVRAAWSRAAEFVLLVSAIFAVVSLVITRRVVGPVTALDRAIAGMPAGRPLPVPVVGEGEVRRLAESFNALAAKLDASFEDQQRLLSRLRDQQGLFSSLVSSLPGILFRSSPSPSGRVHYLSENFTAVTGFPREELVGAPGRSLADLVVEEDRPAVAAARQSAASPGARYDVEYRIRDAAGRVRWMHETGRLAGEEPDGPTWMDGIALDITETHLKDEQLAQAQKMETVGMLAGGIAHDFNNILAVITGATSLARARLEGGGPVERERLQGTLAMLEVAADRATALVAQLLSLSRRKELSLAPLDLVGCVRTVQKLLAGSLDKSVGLTVSVPEGAAMVVADAVQIEQVVLNLCVNAGHAMTFMRPPGAPWGGTLALAVQLLRPDAAFRSLHPEAEERDYWALSVQDTGVGMDERTLERLFTPFFTTKEVGKGTGLGLSIAYTIVRGHRGFLSVSSARGAGSTFTIFLPAMAPGETATAPPAAEPGLPMGSGTVLVVDDEEALRKLAVEILETCGYSVVTAANGDEAVRLHRALAGRVDLVLLDMMMPVMSGREAFARIREIDPHARVLLTSGFREDARVQELLELGVAGFLAKPYSLRSLAQAVADALGRGGGAGGA